MGNWKALSRAAQDTGITDDQCRTIISLQEVLDGRPKGSYAGRTFTMTRSEASRYIDVLQDKLKRKRGNITK